MILGEFGINLGPLIAGAGIIGIALGFGAQSLVKDFLSGIFLVVEDQFGVGDVVDVGEASGLVEGVSLRTTRLRDVEGTVWYVPNGEIRRVGNKSQQWSRALLDVLVAYETDLETAIGTIKEVADAVWHDEVFGPSVLEEPEVWGVEGFGPTGIAIRLVVKTRPADQWKILRELRQRLKSALDAAGVQFGFEKAPWLTPAADPAPPAT
jgi:moderate conductance mechanosensitive channel